MLRHFMSSRACDRGPLRGACGGHDCEAAACALGHLLLPDRQFSMQVRARGKLLLRPPWDRAGFRGTSECLDRSPEADLARLRWGQVYFGKFTGGDPDIPFDGQPEVYVWQLLRIQGSLEEAQRISGLNSAQLVGALTESDLLDALLVMMRTDSFPQPGRGSTDRARPGKHLRICGGYWFSRSKGVLPMPGNVPDTPVLQPVRSLIRRCVYPSWGDAPLQHILNFYWEFAELAPHSDDKCYGRLIIAISLLGTRELWFINAQDPLDVRKVLLPLGMLMAFVCDGTWKHAVMGARCEECEREGRPSTADVLAQNQFPYAYFINSSGFHSP